VNAFFMEESCVTSYSDLGSNGALKLDDCHCFYVRDTSATESMSIPSHCIGKCSSG
jgi:hypothetical protein